MDVHQHIPKVMQEKGMGPLSVFGASAGLRIEIDA
jgi:hypothetical protein